MLVSLSQTLPVCVCCCLTPSDRLAPDSPLSRSSRRSRGCPRRFCTTECSEGAAPSRTALWALARWALAKGGGLAASQPRGRGLPATESGLTPPFLGEAGISDFEVLEAAGPHASLSLPPTVLSLGWPPTVVGP